MMLYTHRPKDQKDLYFTINRFLSSEIKGKLSGIYAIYKDDICVYVGMSNNMAGRIATHLSGKYASSDKIIIFANEDNILDLIPSEKWLIQYLKPMENILANFSEKIDESKILSQFRNNRLFPSFEIIPDEYAILMSVGEVRLNIIDTVNIKKALEGKYTA